MDHINHIDMMAQRSKDKLKQVDDQNNPGRNEECATAIKGQGSEANTKPDLMQEFPAHMIKHLQQKNKLLRQAGNAAKDEDKPANQNKETDEHNQAQETYHVQQANKLPGQAAKQYLVNNADNQGHQGQEVEKGEADEVADKDDWILVDEEGEHYCVV